MAAVGFKALILNSHQTLFLLIGVKPKTTNKSLLLVNLFFYSDTSYICIKKPKTTLIIFTNFDMSVVSPYFTTN